MSKPYDKNKRGGYSKSNSDTGKSSFKRNESPRKFDKKKTDDVPEKIYKPSRANEEIRLNRYVANAGVCSRREADDLIAKGLISVNGEIIKEMGHKVKRKDVVKYKDKSLNPERMVYVLLNKPKDFTTIDDKNATKKAIDLVKHACPERIYPVGKLENSTTGVLLFTNDGELSEQLTHAKYKVKKIFHVTLEKPITKNDMISLVTGFELNGTAAQCNKAEYISPENKHEMGIEIVSAKNGIVREMLEHLGYKVKKMDRVYFAGLTKKNVSRSKWRFLNEKELNLLKMKRFQ